MNIKAIENIGKKITVKKVTIALGIVYLLSLIPIIYLSFFNYATGDDLWEGAAAHIVLMSGGGAKEFCNAIISWFIVDYCGWEGNWSSIILWCLEPSIWGEKAYIITAYIALAAICGCSLYFVNFFVKTYCSDSIWMVCLIYFGTNIMMIQHAPNLKNAFFWYTGMINYMLPFGCMMLVLVWCAKFLLTEKNKYILFMSPVMLYMSGAGYPAIVLVFLGICIECLSYLALRKKNTSSSPSTLIKLAIPTILLIAGFIASAVSPGNAIRGGSNYGFDFHRIIDTVLSCFKYGASYSFEYLLHARLWILVYPLIGCLIFEQIDISKYRYKYPGLFTLAIICLWCAGFSPEIYSMDDVSGGVPNTYFFTFVLCSFFLMTYWLGWIKTKCSNRSLYITKLVIVTISLLFLIVFAPHFYARTTMYECIHYISSGQLNDYNNQMKERLLILEDESITNVVLPEINGFQGPFMHMPATSDPENYTNKCLERFYNKESVICIPRTEWNKKNTE